MNTVTEIKYPCKIDRSMQEAMFLPAEGNGPRPLVVALHTWSYDHTKNYQNYARLSTQYNWHMIFPKFRGPNWLPDACGSDLVVSDLEDAVAYMKKTLSVDPARIYLVGGSGGGHCSLLMAGRRPDLWTAVSSWCPISDIAAWHKQCLGRPCECYSNHIVSACGGDPAADEKVRMEARKRSPLAWLDNAADALPVDIGTGIHDGHTGSVPVSQAVNAFNLLAEPQDRISDEDIAYIVEKEAIPAHLQGTFDDPVFGTHTIHFRRQSKKARLTLFEGGHDILCDAAFSWLSKQCKGKTPDWSPGEAVEGGAQLSAIAK